MQTPPPRFSIIIATYNAARTIKRCVRSIRAQTIRAQIIVADGLSKDATLQIVKGLNDPDIQIVSERDTGVYDAWNKGLKIATGEWIIFLGADDYYADPQALQSLADAISSAPAGQKLFYGVIEGVDSNDRPLSEENVAWDRCSVQLERGMPFTHVGTAHASSLFSDGRVFDASFRIAGDYNFLLPILREIGATFVPTYRVRMEMAGLSNDRRNRLRLLKEQLRIRRTHGVRFGVRDALWFWAKFAYYRCFHAR